VCDETVSTEQMVTELEALRLAGISVFSVAISNRADESEVRGISSVPQLANINYFISPTITNLTSLSSLLAAQVCYCMYMYMYVSSVLCRCLKKIYLLHFTL